MVGVDGKSIKNFINYIIYHFQKFIINLSRLKKINEPT